MNNPQSRSQRFWQVVDKFGRRMSTSIGVAMIAFLVFFVVGSIIFGLIMHFREIGWQRAALDVSATVIGVGVLYLARRPLCRFVVNLGRLLYYAIAVGFYSSAVITAFSLLSRAFDGLDSFLAAPIGIKPDAQLGQLGSAFYFLLALTAVLGVAYLVVRFLRGVTDEFRELATLGSPPPEATPSTLDVKASS